MAKLNYTPPHNVTTAQIEPELQGDENIILQVGLNNTGDDFTLGPLTDDDLASMDLRSGGVITGGIIQDVGNGLTTDGGTLNNVKYEGVLNVGSGSLFVDDDLTITGVTGTGAGTINVDDGILYLENTQTLDNATVNLTNSAELQQYTTSAAYQAAGNTYPPETLTFGANLVIDLTSATGYINSGGDYTTGTSSVVNDGEIETQGTGSVFNIGPSVFTNAGSLDVAGTDATVNISSGSSSNTGTIDVAGTDATVDVSSVSFSNTGTIDVASGDTFELTSYAYSTAAALGGTLNAASGTIELNNATLDNTSATISIGSGNHIGAFYLYGGNTVVSGGIIKDGGSGLVSNSATLDDVTYEGALSLQSGSLSIDDGTTFTGAGGTGAGSLTADAATLNFYNSQTVNDDTITLSVNGQLQQYTTYAAYVANGNTYPTETLTFGAKTVVEATSGGGTLSTGGYSSTSAIVNNGEIAETQNSVLYIGPSVFTNNNLIEAQGGGTVYLYSGSITNLSSDANYAGGSVLTGGTYAADDGATGSEINFEYTGVTKITTLAATADITGANSKIVSNNVTLDDSLDDITSTGALNLSYSAVSDTQAFFDDTATNLIVDGAANIHGSTLQTGAMTIDASGVVTGVGESNGSTPKVAVLEAVVANNGVIVAGVAGGGNPTGDPESRFEIVGPVTGTGKLEIQGNTIAELSGASHGQQILFENTETTEPATLQIDTTSVGTGASPKFTSAIAGFETGDVIDLAHLNVANLTGHTFNGTTLSLTFSGATTSASLTFSGLNAGDTFNFATDGANGTDISLVACYGRGARIATPHGDVAIEALREGDLVLTASGASRPVRWIGHRWLDISRHPNPKAVWPVRVSANAFGEGLPRRDLWLSPGHNVACEDALTPVCGLVNGVSIAQIAQDEVEYWHIELDTHDVILAEGLPAESYLDTGNRAAFANGGAFIEAHPDFAPKHWAETCLPLVHEGPVLARTKARLLERLRAQGLEPTTDGDVHIVADGRRLEPTVASSMQLSFDLPAPCHDIVLTSRRFTPAHMLPESADSRELGVCIARLRVDGVDLPLEREDLFEEGWREAEWEDGRVARRWTGGAARLPRGARSVSIDLAGDGYYYCRAKDEGVATLVA